MASTIPDRDGGNVDEAGIGKVFIHSRPFDVHRWTDHLELNNCVTLLRDEVEALEGRKRARNKNAAKKFREAIRCIVLDLYVGWKSDPDLQISIAFGANHFTPTTRYDAFYLSYRPFKAAFDGLKKLGYLTIDKKGYHDAASGRGRVTKVRATEKLIDLLTGAGASVPAVMRSKSKVTIILRGPDKSKSEINYVDTPFTEKARQRLATINDTLSRQWYDLYLTQEQLDQLTQRMGERAQTDHDKPAYIDYSARTLHRVFNNGRWDQGGRFYGGWWQIIPSEYRKYITINGQWTAELDYSGMHAVMLYSEVGVELPIDPYDPNYNGVPNASRDLIKLTFNALINAPTKRIQCPTTYDAGKIGLSWEGFRKRITQAHEPLMKFFYSGHGLSLQARDAEIAEDVMLQFAKNYPCLPVHDSFIVHCDLVDELRDIMLEAFERHTGVSIGMKEKESMINTYMLDDEEVDMHTTVLDYLDFNNPYDERHRAWFDLNNRH